MRHDRRPRRRSAGGDVGPPVLCGRRRRAAPEAQRLTERIQGLVASLIAARTRTAAGPGSAAVPDPTPVRTNRRPASDRLASAAVVWALASAEPLGLLTDVKVLDQAVAYLKPGIRARPAATITRPARLLLHALSTRHAASFEAANSLEPHAQRAVRPGARLPGAHVRQPGSDVAGRRARSASWPRGPRPRRPPPGIRPASTGTTPAARRRSAAPPRRRRWSRLAFARVRPQAPELDGAVAWLLAHRAGTGWQPHKAKGPALAALAAYLRPRRGRRGPVPADRHRQRDRGRPAQRRRARPTARPSRSRARRSTIGQPNRVRFEHGGTRPLRLRRHARGVHPRFRARPGPARTASPRSIAASISRRHRSSTARCCRSGSASPSTRPTSKTWPARSRWAARPVSRITAWRNIPDNTPEWERDFLIVEEHLPAGTTLIEGSVQHDRHRRIDLADGVLTFYFAPDQNPGVIAYDVYGYLPGQYRALPASDHEAPTSRAVPPRPGERAARAGARRAEHRSVQADPRRALCPRQGPLRRRPVRRGRPRPSSRSSPATRSATTSPRTPPACSC